MSEIKINEVDVQKLNLQPGEVLVIKVKSDDISMADMNALRKNFNALFPNNKAVILGIGETGSIDLTVAKQAEYPETSFCSDCNCGKKAAYEGE